MAAGDMGQPQIVFLEREVFALYREMKMFTTGLSEAQLKTPRVLTTPELIAFFTSQAELRKAHQANDRSFIAPS